MFEVGTSDLIRQPLAYQTPAISGIDRIRSDQLRGIARVLAFAGTTFGIICACFILLGGWKGVVIFAPGYIATGGYFWRGFGRVSRVTSRVIWAFSSIVQGAWLCAVSIGSIRGGFDIGVFLFSLWWLMATLFSVAGAFVDPGWLPDARQA